MPGYDAIFLLNANSQTSSVYEDGWSDGKYYLSGEGLNGDQQMTFGNKALKDSISNEKSKRIFLFEPLDKSKKPFTRNMSELTANSTISGFIRPIKGGRQAFFDKGYAGEGTITLEPNGSLSYYYGTKGGYGKVIIVQHGQHYRTVYAHLSGFSKGLKVGSEVEQKQVIGYVGSTGAATGAHLHYEILVNNRQVNPMTVRLPTGKQIDPSHLVDFKKQVQMVEAEVLARGTQRFAAAVLAPTTP